MRMQTLAARALLTGFAYERLPTVPGTSPNPGQGLVAIGTGNNVATSSCDIGETTCGIGCMPLASVCCSGYVPLTNPTLISKNQKGDVLTVVVRKKKTEKATATQANTAPNATPAVP